MPNEQVVRKLGERKPLILDVTYPEATDLTGLPVLFYMGLKGQAPKIDGAIAQAADVSPAEAPLTRWRLSYAFDADDLDTAGKYLSEFEVDFGAGQKRYYPPGSEFVEVKVIAHPATS